MFKKIDKVLLVLAILLIICLSLVSILYGGLYVFAITNVVKVCSLLLMCVFFLTKYVMVYNLTLGIFKDKPVILGL